MDNLGGTNLGGLMQMQMNTMQRQRESMLMNQMAIQQRVQLNGNAACTEEAGTLFVQDSFVPNLSQGNGEDIRPPHGFEVVRAARQHGFQGTVVGAPNTGSSLDFGRDEGQRGLMKPDATPAEVRQSMEQISVAHAGGLLDRKSEYLEGLTERGVRNSVVNFSQGDSKASTADFLYSGAAGYWAESTPAEQRPVFERVLNNYARTFELDADKLKSEDPAVHGPERQRLQQALVDTVDRDYNTNPTIQTQKERWEGSVKNFEANNNSVVIAGSNEGDYHKRFQFDNGGREVRLPDDYSQNVLETPEVTSVGATRWFETANGLKEFRANYTSRGADMRVFASGSLSGHRPSDDPNRAQGAGTSLAAPRVAAIMAELHRQNPTMTSAQIENLMLNQFTRPLESNGQQIQVLDYQTTANFLVQQPVDRGCH